MQQTKHIAHGTADCIRDSSTFRQVARQVLHVTKIFENEHILFGVVAKEPGEMRSDLGDLTEAQVDLCFTLHRCMMRYARRLF